jgi:ABC-type polysaccharide/polyol phosphate export permease
VSRRSFVSRLPQTRFPGSFRRDSEKDQPATVSVLASVTTHRELIENLVLRDIKARYKQSLLGYAWAFFNPLVLTIIYYIVGGIFLGQASGKFPFAIHVCFGLVFWNLFATGLMSATEGLVSHINLITKVYFPREVFPISAVMSKLMDFGFGLLAVVPLLLIFGIVPNVLGLLLLIPITGFLLLFTMGLGMLTSCANLFYRDVRYLVQLLLGFWVYLIPNMYTLERVAPHPTFYKIYMLNPVATLIESARRIVFPQTGPIEELYKYLALACGTSLVVFALGYLIFKRNEPRFAEYV